MDDLGQRRDVACDRLIKAGVRDILRTPLCRLRHRLGETLGEVLLCLQSWQEDEESSAIQGIVGRGSQIWAEIRAILLGEGTCEWMERTKLPSVVQCLGDDLNARRQVEGFLQKTEAQQLGQLLADLDGDRWRDVRARIIKRRDREAVAEFRSWYEELDKYLRTCQPQPVGGQTQ